MQALSVGQIYVVITAADDFPEALVLWMLFPEIISLEAIAVRVDKEYLLYCTFWTSHEDQLMQVVHPVLHFGPRMLLECDIIPRVFIIMNCRKVAAGLGTTDAWDHLNIGVNRSADLADSGAPA